MFYTFSLCNLTTSLAIINVTSKMAVVNFVVKSETVIDTLHSQFNACKIIYFWKPVINSVLYM